MQKRSFTTRMMLPSIRHRHVGFVLLVFSVFFVTAVRAEQKCPVLAVRDAPEAHNIFSAQQEFDLGDIEAALLEERYEVIADAGLTAHLTAINNRLLSPSPISGTNIRIVLIETPEAVAFSAGASRLYISRRMVAALHNDDELAGLLGHELAHMLRHQNAIVVSQVFHDFLGVSVVEDRNDIAEKFNRMLNSSGWHSRTFPSTAQRLQQNEGTSQQEADRFALHALAAAGFSPRAYAEFFDRFAGTHGKHGNLLTDLLSITTPNERRLRKIYKSLHSLPQSCRDMPSPPASPEFLAWQAEVVRWPSSTSPRRGSK